MADLTPILDDFNRADGDLGADWTTAFAGTEATITGNKFTAVAFNGLGAWVADTFPDDFVVFAEPTGQFPGGETHFLLMVEDETDATPSGFRVKAFSNVLQLFRHANSDWYAGGSLIQSWTVAVGDGAQVGLARVGTALTMYLDGVANPGGSVTDAGSPGALKAVMYIDHSSRSWDNFGGNAGGVAIEASIVQQSDRLKKVQRAIY